jgi:hypothetical protein
MFINVKFRKTANNALTMLQNTEMLVKFLVTCNHHKNQFLILLDRNLNTQNITLKYIDHPRQISVYTLNLLIYSLIL